MKTIAFAVALSMAVGWAVYFLTPTKAAKVPLTYSNPIRVVTSTVRVGGEITTLTTRCNHTDHAIDVESDIFWQSADNKILIPYTSLDGRQVGRVQSVVDPGCRDLNRDLALPAAIVPMKWRLIGSVCYGSITLNGPQHCTRWNTTDFEVTP